MSQSIIKLLLAALILLGLITLFGRSAASQTSHVIVPAGRYQLTVVVEPSLNNSDPVDHQYLTDTLTGQVWERENLGNPWVAEGPTWASHR